MVIRAWDYGGPVGYNYARTRGTWALPTSRSSNNINIYNFYGSPQRYNGNLGYHYAMNYGCFNYGYNRFAANVAAPFLLGGLIGLGVSWLANRA